MKRGWFYFAPIYFNPETNELNGRGYFSELLLIFAIDLHHLVILAGSLFASAMCIDYEPSYPIHITGEARK